MPTFGAIVSVLAIFALLSFWVVAFLIIYHLTRFGVGVQPKRLAAAFLLGSVLFFTTAVISLGKINFNTLLP